MLYFIGILLLIILLYVFSLRGRVGFTDFKDFKGERFAHRGLHGAGVPENSLWAFRRALERGYGSELDVHLLADGELAIMHDHSLKRTAGVDVKIEDLTLSDLENYHLEGTQEKIPTLKEVLNLYDGRKPLIIELKATKNDIDKLCRQTAVLLKSYKGKYCIESFDPRVVRWFKVHCPQVIRGQLAENYFKNKKSDLQPIIKFVMTYLLTNFLTCPDFVAYRFSHRKNISFRLCTGLHKIQGAAWTVKGEKEITLAEDENLISIFEE